MTTTTAPTREEIDELIEFCRCMLSNVDGAYAVLTRYDLVCALAIVERLPALLAERDALKKELDRLDTEAARLEIELSDATGLWPHWASEVLNIIRAKTGYDGIDDSWDGVDLPAELRDLLGSLSSDREELKTERDRLAAEIERLKIGLSSIVCCQSALPRAAVREACAEILNGKTTRMFDQSPFVAALSSARATIAELREALAPFANSVYNDNGDVTIIRNRPDTEDWMRARAALAKLDEPPTETIDLAGVTSFDEGCRQAERLGTGVFAVPPASKRRFSVGDKVVRISGGEWFEMGVGDVGTINKIQTVDNWCQIWLDEFSGVYSSFNFRSAATSEQVPPHEAIDEANADNPPPEALATPKPFDEMTEEELLAGLEGLVPPSDARPAETERALAEAVEIMKDCRTVERAVEGLTFFIKNGLKLNADSCAVTDTEERARRLSDAARAFVEKHGRMK